MSKPMPAVFHHCVDIYEAMERDAEENEDGQLQWVGFTTKLFKKQGLAVPLYTAVTQHLKRMDCIRQLMRGGGGSPSAWVLLQAPTEELFLASPGYRVTQKDEVQAQQIRDLNERINSMERDNEIRFARLETKGA